MAMKRFEKLFVNRGRKAERNIEKVRPRLEQWDVENLYDTLELGCGIGAVSEFLSESYQMNVVGTDFDSAQIELARSNYSENDKLHISVEDSSNLSFEDGSFDLVLSQNVFHHISAWRTAEQEIARVLRPRGYLIWLDLSFPHILKAIFQPIVKNYGLYTLDDIKAEFNESGFRQFHYERLAHGIFAHHHFVLQKSGG